MEALAKKVQNLEVTLTNRIQQIDQNVENFCSLSFDDSYRRTRLGEEYKGKTTGKEEIAQVL